MNERRIEEFDGKGQYSLFGLASVVYKLSMSVYRVGLLTVLLCLGLTNHISGDSTISDCDETALRTAISAGGTVTLTCDGIIELSETIAITNDVTITAEG